MYTSKYGEARLRAQADLRGISNPRLAGSSTVKSISPHGGRAPIFQTRRITSSGPKSSSTASTKGGEGPALTLLALNGTLRRLVFETSRRTRSNAASALGRQVAGPVSWEDGLA